MDDNNKYDVQDLVISAIQQKPETFSQAFNDVLVDKLQAAVEARKYEISQEMFAGPNDPEDEFEPESEEDEYEEEDVEGIYDAEYETELDSEEQENDGQTS